METSLLRIVHFAGVVQKILLVKDAEGVRKRPLWNVFEVDDQVFFGWVDDAGVAEGLDSGGDELGAKVLASVVFVWVEAVFVE